MDYHVAYSIPQMYIDLLSANIVSIEVVTHLFIPLEWKLLFKLHKAKYLLIKEKIRNVNMNGH